MRHRVSFLCMALFFTAGAGMAQQVDYLRVLLRRPIPWTLNSPEAGEPGPEIGESLEWRAMTMRDEHGEIPTGARYQANLERRQNLARPRGRVGGLTANSASINPASWVSRGPDNCGGRTRALLITSNGIYAGAATGGVWKSTDDGATWTPLTDFMANINISTMVADPVNPNIIYVGTGEGKYSQHGDDGLPGAGIFKTTDGGASWAPLQETAGWRYVRRLSIKPGTTGASAVLLAANELGVWRSANGGDHWTQVYTGSANVVAFNPNNGQQAVADTTIPGDYRRLLYSTDGGVSFLIATLPPDPPNPPPDYISNRDQKTGNLAVAWGTGSNVYVNFGIDAGLSASGQGGLGVVWHSSDGGTNFIRKSQAGVGTTCSFHCAIWASPDAPNLIVAAGERIKRSSDGGVTFTEVGSGGDLSDLPHYDTHFLVNHPAAHDKLYIAGDGGVYVTADTASILTVTPTSGWKNLNATYRTTQFYGAVGTVQWQGLILIGGTHDNATLRVAGSNATRWTEGDGGFVAIDPIDANYMYGEDQNHRIYRSTNGGGTGDFIAVLPANPTAIAPLVMDPNDRNTLLSGDEKLRRTTEATAQSPEWKAISPTGSGISAVAAAKGNSNIIWFGRVNGDLLKTTDGLAETPSWNAFDGGLPDRSILRILIDPDDSNRVYVALGGYTANSSTPQNLWRTTNGGASWQPISGAGAVALPRVPVRAIARHPRNQQRLYVGTDIGIYESEDGGMTWTTTQQGPADVTTDDLSFVYGTETLLAATHGRGLWTADTYSVPTYQPIAPPGGLVATASGTTSVNLSWSAVSGATQYQLFRSVDGSGYIAIAPLTSTSYADNSLQANKTYLYKVRASNGTSWSDLSAPDLATTVVFDYDNALTGHLVTVALMQQLYTAVNAVRSSAGLSPSLSPPAAGSFITAASLNDLRAALSNAYGAIQMPAAPSFSQLDLGNPVNAAFFQEVRNAVK